MWMRDASSAAINDFALDMPDEVDAAHVCFKAGASAPPEAPRRKCSMQPLHLRATGSMHGATCNVHGATCNVPGRCRTAQGVREGFRCVCVAACSQYSLESSSARCAELQMSSFLLHIACGACCTQLHTVATSPV